MKRSIRAVTGSQRAKFNGTKAALGGMMSFLVASEYFMSFDLNLVAQLVFEYISSPPAFKFDFLQSLTELS